MSKNEIRTKYIKFVQQRDDGTIELPLPLKIEIFWELYPNGSISINPPERNETGDGISTSCLLYGDRENIHNSLIVKTNAERSAVLPEDSSEDIYAAARDAALSEALSAVVDSIFK